MTKFEEELCNLPVSIVTNYGDYWNKAQLLTVFKDWQPQQPLPVVPECVGNFLSGKSIFKIANGDIPDDVISWVQEQTYYVDLEKIISHLISLKITGYQVEKPQLFYLKNKLTGLYLYRLDKVDFREQDYCKDRDDKPLDYCLFTQQEIDSMQTGSYELVPVEDGE